jgi:hypothetical protein
MQHGIGTGTPWEQICFIKYPLPTQEDKVKKRKVISEFSIVTCAKKTKSLKEIAILACSISAQI